MRTIASPEEKAEATAVGIDWYGTKAHDWDSAVLLVRELVALCDSSASAAPV